MAVFTLGPTTEVTWYQEMQGSQQITLLGDAGESPFEAEQITPCEFPLVFYDLSSPHPHYQGGDRERETEGKGHPLLRGRKNKEFT